MENENKAALNEEEIEQVTGGMVAGCSNASVGFTAEGVANTAGVAGCETVARRTNTFTASANAGINHIAENMAHGVSGNTAESTGGFWNKLRSFFANLGL